MPALKRFLEVFMVIITSLVFPQALLLGQVPAYVPAYGLLGWWPFDGNPRDVSGNGNDLSVYGATVNADGVGRNGYSYAFDGIDDWMTAGKPLFSGRTQLTVAFWIRTTSTGGMDIVGQYCKPAECWGDMRVQLGTPQCSNRTGLSFKSPSHFANVEYPTNSDCWHHFALVFGSNDQFSFADIQFYIDGRNVAPPDCQHNWGGWTYDFVSEPFDVSPRQAVGLGGPFKGSIDELGVWKRALSSDEVFVLYDRAKPSGPRIVDLTTSSNKVCQRDSVELRALVAGGTCPYVYHWKIGGLEQRTSSPKHSAQIMASEAVQLIVEDAFGICDTSYIAISVLPKPSISIDEYPRGTLLASPTNDIASYQWLDSAQLPLTGATDRQYKPSRSGEYYVLVRNITDCYDTSDAYRYIASFDSKIDVSSYEFGELPVEEMINEAGGHVGSVRVRNLSGENVELTGASTSDPSVFVVPQQWPRRLTDGDTAQITVRFKPTEKRQYQSVIDVSNTLQLPATGRILGTGRDLGPDERVTQVVLRPVREEVDPGDTISVMLRISIERPIVSVGQAGQFIVSIQWDNRVLEPLPTPGMLYDTAGTYGLAQVLNGYRQQNQDQLYRFRFRAKQAEVDTTSIIFSGAQGFIWQDDRKAYPALVDSVVRVRVCRDSGPQLIGRVAQPRLISVTPNPAREKILVTYESQVPTTLELVTMDGRVVKQLPLRAERATITIDAADIGRGTYMLVIGKEEQQSSVATVVVE
jgi:hypothetical protein